MNSVIVSGGFDDLRSRHIRLLEEAAKFGQLHVLLWSDVLLGKPKFPEAERQYLVEAIRGGYELRYADDEPQAFAALLELFSPDEVRLAAAYAARLGLILTGDLRGWPVAARAVVRFVLAHGLEAERC